LDENQQMQQARMMDLLLTSPLGVEKDKPVWNLSKTGLFSVNTMYKKLSEVWVNGRFKYRWMAKYDRK
jgi:hypothetical protein